MNKRTWKLSAAQRDSVAADYLSGMSRGQICKKYGLRSPKSVSTLLKYRGVKTRQGIHPRRFVLNDTVFDCVTDESAYWAGFILSDGHISMDGDRPEGIQVVLAECDKAHLLKLRKFAGSNTKLRWTPERTSRLGWNEMPQWKLTLYSKKLTASLMALGIGTKKQLAPSCLLLTNTNFWRGVVDGDGAVYWANGQARILLVGPKDTVHEFWKFVQRAIGPTVAAPRPAKNIWCYGVNGIYAYKLARVLYGQCGTALARKLQVAKEFQNCLE